MQIKKRLQNIENPKSALGQSDNQLVVNMYKELFSEIEIYTAKHGKLRFPANIKIGQFLSPHFHSAPVPPQPISHQYFREEFMHMYEMGVLPAGMICDRPLLPFKLQSQESEPEPETAC